MKASVDWNKVLTAEGAQVGSVVGGATAPRRQHDTESSDHGDTQEEEEPGFLTIGLIGSRFLIWYSYVGVNGDGFRAAQCWQIVTLECSIWHT